MKEKVNYQEWVLQNPGRSINDFYREFPSIQKTAPSNFITQPITQPITQFNSQNEFEAEVVNSNIDIGNIIFSIGILIGFVLPWIDIKFLGVVSIGESSGFDLPKILINFVEQTDSMHYRLYSIYLIPIGAVMSLFGETIRSEFLRSTGQILSICSLLLWSCVFYYLVKSVGLESYGIDLYQVMSFGFYASLIGCAYYFYDVIIRMR